MNSRLALGRDLESLSKTGASQTGVTLEALIVVLGRLRASAEDLLSSSSGDEARRILTNEIDALKTYEVDARDLLARRPAVVAQEPAPASLDERLKEHLRSQIMYGNARAFFKPGTTTKITMELVGSDRWILHAGVGSSKKSLQTPVSLDQAIDLLVQAGATKALSPAMPPPAVPPAPAMPSPAAAPASQPSQPPGMTLEEIDDLRGNIQLHGPSSYKSLEEPIAQLARMLGDVERRLAIAPEGERERVMRTRDRLVEAIADLQERQSKRQATKPPAGPPAPAPVTPSVSEAQRQDIANVVLHSRGTWFEKPGDTRRMRAILSKNNAWIVETYSREHALLKEERAESVGRVVDILVGAGFIVPLLRSKAPAPPAPVPTPTAPPAAAPVEIVFPLSALLPPRESYREDTDKGVLVYVGPGELGVDDKGKPRIFPYARWVEAPAEVGGHAVFIPKGKAGGADVRLVSPAGKLVVAFDGPKPDGSFEVFLHAGFRRADGGKIVKNTWQGHVRDPILAGYKLLEGTLGAARTIVVPVPAGYCLSLVRSGLALRDAAVLYDPVVTGLEGALSMTTPTREIAVGWNNRGVQADLYELRLQRDVRHRHAITSLTLASPADIPEAVSLLSRK